MEVQSERSTLNQNNLTYNRKLIFFSQFSTEENNKIHKYFHFRFIYFYILFLVRFRTSQHFSSNLVVQGFYVYLFISFILCTAQHEQIKGCVQCFLSFECSTRQPCKPLDLDPTTERRWGYRVTFSHAPRYLCRIALLRI